MSQKPEKYAVDNRHSPVPKVVFKLEFLNHLLWAQALALQVWALARLD